MAHIHSFVITEMELNGTKTPEVNGLNFRHYDWSASFTSHSSVAHSKPEGVGLKSKASFRISQ